jgi:hypothetical protein
VGVRKTESRLPANYQASDLGEAVVAADGRCTLVSFVTAPIVIKRHNTYVLFVTDPGLGSTAQFFEWTFTLNEDVLVRMTARSVVTYWSSSTGKLNIDVRVLDGGGASQAMLSMEQEVVDPSSEVEDMIEKAAYAPGAGSGNPEVLRELVNEHSRYYQAVVPQLPEAGDAFKRFTFSFVWDGVQHRPPKARGEHVDQLSAALNEQPLDFIRLAAEGVGVSDLRLALMAMTVPSSPGSAAMLIPWTELPEDPMPRAFADEQLRVVVGALSEPVRIDLFNLARFPKSNITQCARVLEALRNRYFAGATFEDVLTGMSGTRAHWITRHYREGPLKRMT